MRSRDKLAEGRFFLTLLRRSRGKLPRAAYYASAAIGALRSVTWVLQSDLRAKYQERFDSWWREQVTRLSDVGEAFRLVQRSRNDATKRGIPLGRPAVRKVYDSGAVTALTFTIDPLYESPENFDIELRPGTIPTIHNGATDPELEEMAQKLMEDTQDILAKMKDFGRAWAEDEVEYETVLCSPPRRFPEALRVLTEYADALERLLQAAEHDFAA